MSFLADRSAVSIGLGGIPSLRSGTGGLNPSLDLNFAVSKTLDPRITFTRASEGRYYDASTVAVAEQNLLLQSQTFDNASWAKAGQGVGLAPVITADYAAAPDGTTTAERAQFSLNGGTTSSDISRVSQTVTIAAGVDATFSIWMRSTDGVSSYAMQIVGPSGAGSAVTVTGTWTRFTVTAASGGAVGYAVRLRGASSPTNANTADILVWGAQLEQRSTVTAYTPTTTAAVTNYIPVLQVAANGVARFDHNPVTRESLGLLVEEQRTNLLTYSEQFDNAAWSKSASTIAANTVVSPDGTIDADKIVEDTSASAHRIISSSFTPTLTPYTFSFYAKAAGRQYAYIRLNNSGGDFVAANVDLSTATVTQTIAGTITATSVGNGWVRITGTGTPATTALANAEVRTSNSATYANYTGDGFSGIYIWGAQLEAGAFSTSYIPTVASQVTRSAEYPFIESSSFTNQSQGTFYAEFRVERTSGPGSYWIIGGDGSNSKRYAYIGPALTNFQTFDGSSILGSAQSVTAGVSAKIASAYDAYGRYISAMGGATTSGTVAAGYAPTNTVTLGAIVGVNQLNGTIKRITYYPVRLANATLQSLTA